MREIIFYKLNGEILKTIPLTEENLGGIHGMMTRCYLNNDEVVEGLSDVFRVFDEDKSNNKVQDYIYLCTWDNLDEKTGQLIGSDEDKYNITRKKVILRDIVMVEAILYSNPRWGVGLANKFEFFNKSNKFKRLDMSEQLKNLDNNDNNEEDNKLYYYLLVKYEDTLSNKKYNYISDDTTIKINDRVLVDRAGEQVIAKVIETGIYTKEDCPYPIEKTKSIIKKVNEDYIIERKKDYEIDYNDEEDEDNYDLQDSLRLYIQGTDFIFSIKNYVLTGDNDKDWTNIKLKIYNLHFCYYIEKEIITSGEVDLLLKNLQLLLKNKLNKNKKMEFYEPDLEFIFYPEGKENELDIFMELVINLTNNQGEYINQKYIIGFDKEKIQYFTAYIENIVYKDSYRPM